MDQSSALLTWTYFSHGKTVEELRQTLVYTTLELEQTKLVAQEERRKRDEQLIHLEDVLTKTLKERDEALEKCNNLLYDNLLLQQQQKQNHITPPLSGASSIIEDEKLQPQQQKQLNPNSNKSFSSSDTEESIMSPSVIDPVTMNQASQVEIMASLLLEKPLPEKGNLLQAVLKAGPLLQTLLLAGPLPQWRHPPPPLETSEIPPVTVPPPQFQCSIVNNGCGTSTKKRAFSISDGSYSETKYQRV